MASEIPKATINASAIGKAPINPRARVTAPTAIPPPKR